MPNVITSGAILRDVTPIGADAGVVGAIHLALEHLFVIKDKARPLA
jgi:hypothetical protein